MKYNILLWDVDGTILDFSAAERNAIRALFQKYSLGECTDEMLAEYAKINVSYWKKVERKEISRNEALVGRFRDFFSRHQLPVDVIVPFNDDYQLALGDTLVFHDDAYVLLSSLKGVVRQYVITNGTKAAQQKKLRQGNLLSVFDGIFISEDVGYDKPSVEYFSFVKKNIPGFSEEKALVIGDSLTSDIRGGNNAGIDTCWYNPEGKENDQGVSVTHMIRNLNEIPSLLQ